MGGRTPADDRGWPAIVPSRADQQSGVFCLQVAGVANGPRLSFMCRAFAGWVAGVWGHCQICRSWLPVRPVSLVVDCAVR
jgi:hypothetical protein